METPYLVRESPASGLCDTWVQVLVDAPGARRVYTYRVAAGMVVAGGDVVCVPFGSQKIGGIVLERLDTLPPSLVADQVKTVEEVLGAGFFPPGYWQLLEQVAHYYLTPLARVLETALPPGLLARSQRRIRLAAITNPLLEWTLSPSTRAMLEFVRAHKADVSWRFLRQRLPHAQYSLTELLNRGLVESYLADPDPPRPLVRQVVVLVELESEG
ncbi:MAG: primosomal protein N', partial [Gemmatimonadaceae bacterium]|nr:primosomal protein N' [Gloeobacterales cyanobacterium ES-bin-141]